MIIGFGITKIEAERKQGVKGKININNNISLKGVEDAKMSTDAKKIVLRLTFAFDTQYKPDLGKISLEGDVMVLLDKDEGTKIINDWKKDKKMPSDFLGPVINHVMDRCNLQSLSLCKDMNLPAPIPLPKVNIRPVDKK